VVTQPETVAAGPAPERLARSVATSLADAGTRTVYGVPGGGNNLELVGACEDAGLRFVLAHYETAAAIMASVAGELSGAPGACLVTRGPGAASAVNGVAQALLDRAPVAVVTDAVSWSDRERIPHQRLDQRALFGPVAKWSGTFGARGADEAVRAALAFALAPPRGPIHLDFVPDAPHCDSPPDPAPHQLGDAAAAKRLLAASRRPVFALGVGARTAVAPLRELLAGKPWPVLTTYKAKGAIPETWPNAAGLLTGATIEAPVLAAADLIVAVGLDPVELIPARWGYPARVLALAEWPTDDPYFTPDTELVGPLEELLEFVQTWLHEGFDGTAAGRQTRLAAEARLVAAPAVGIGPQHVVLAARTAAPAGTIATIDAGAHMLATMPLWEVDGLDEALISSGLATMGFSLPAAIAASVERPDRQVICFTGDGGLGMTLAELETLSRLGTAVLVVVLNDSALSLIEIKQRPEGHGGKNAVRYRPTDFAGIAQSVGITSRRVGSRDELAGAFAEGLAANGPFLLDIDLDARGYPEIMATIRGGSHA
jgi:acetolactate synthase-1/2/3 large subunit